LDTIPEEYFKHIEERLRFIRFRSGGILEVVAELKNKTVFIKLWVEFEHPIRGNVFKRRMSSRREPEPHLSKITNVYSLDQWEVDKESVISQAFDGN
jgi:hypothetical protein